MLQRLMPLLVVCVLIPTGCDRGPDWDDLEARPLTDEELARLEDRAERIDVEEVIASQSKTEALQIKTSSQTALYRAKDEIGGRLWLVTTCTSSCEPIEPVPASTPAAGCPNVGCVPKGTTCTAPDCDACPAGPCTKTISGFGDLRLVTQ